MADGTLINAGSGTIELSSDGTVTLGGLLTTNSTIDAVKIVSGGAVNDGGDSHIDIEANSPGARVTIVANNGIGNGNPLDTRINLLAATVSNSGDLLINEGDGLELARIDQQGSGAITIAAQGTITIVAGTGGVSSTFGAVQLDANGKSSDLIVNEIIVTQGGDIDLFADRNVGLSASGDISTSDGDLTVRADDQAGDNGGSILMSDGAFANVGSGQISMSADGDIILGGLLTTNGTASAVKISSTSGGILDGGDAHFEIDANVPGSVVSLSAASGIGNGNPLEVRMYEVVATNSTAGDIQLVESDSLRIASIGQQGPGSVDISVSGTAEILAAASGVSSTVGAISIRTIGIGADLIVAAPVTTTLGDINLSAGRHVIINGLGDLSSSAGDVSLMADTAAGDNGGMVAMADQALIDAGTGIIRIVADGDVSLGGLLTLNATASAVTILSNNGAILDAGDAHVDVVANSIGSVVTLAAKLGIGNGNPLETNINTLVARNSHSGAIQINELSSIELGRFDQQGSGAIEIIANGSVRVIDQVSATSGSINLTANGTNADVMVQEKIASSSGQIVLSADRNVVFAMVGGVTTSSGDVTVRADDAVGNQAGNVRMADGALIDAGSGKILVEADGSIFLGGLRTTNATSAALVVSSSNGAILDGGDTHVDIVANAVGSLVTLTARDGIGLRNPLEIQVHELTASVTGVGGIFVSELDSLIVRQFSTFDGDIGLVAGGNVFAQSVDAGGNGDIALIAGNAILVGNLVASNDEILLRAVGEIDDISASSMVTARRLSIDAGSSVHLHDTHVSFVEGMVGGNTLLQSFQPLNATANRVGQNILDVLNQNLPSGVSFTSNYISGESQSQIINRFSFVESFGNEYALYIVNTGDLTIGNLSATGAQPHIYIETKGQADLSLSGVVAVQSTTDAQGGAVLIAGGKMAINGGELVTSTITPAANQAINSVDLNFRVFNGGQGPLGAFDPKATTPQFLSTHVVLFDTGAENGESHVRQRISTQFGSAGERGFVAIARYADGQAQLFDALGEVDLANSLFRGVADRDPSASIAAFPQSSNAAGVFTRATPLSTDFLSTYQWLPTTIVMRRSTDFFLFEDGGQVDLTSQSSKVSDVISLGDKISLPLIQDPKLVEAPRPIAYHSTELPLSPMQVPTSDVELKIVIEREPEVFIYRVAFHDRNKDGQAEQGELPSFEEILREGPQSVTDSSESDADLRPEIRPGTRLGERIPVKVSSGSFPTAEDIDAWKRELQSDPQRPSGVYTIIEKDVNQKETVLDVFPIRDWPDPNSVEAGTSVTPRIEPQPNIDPRPANARSQSDAPDASPAHAQPVGPKPTDGAWLETQASDSNYALSSADAGYASIICGAWWLINSTESSTKGIAKSAPMGSFSGTNRVAFNRIGRKIRRIGQLLSDQGKS